MNQQALAAQLFIDEGKRLDVYHGALDRPGVWTVGVGHQTRPEDRLYLGQTITEAQCATFLDHDIQEAVNTCNRLWPPFPDFPEEIQQVLGNMAFQLGEHRLGLFQRFHAAIVAQNWPLAAVHGRRSLWYDQVPARAERLMTRLEQWADNG